MNLKKVAMYVNHILGCMSKGEASKAREVRGKKVIPLYLALVRLYLEYRVQSLIATELDQVEKAWQEAH